MILFLVLSLFRPVWAVEYDADFVQRYAHHLRSQNKAGHAAKPIEIQMSGDANGEPQEIRMLEDAAQYFANIIDSYKTGTNQDFSNLNDFRAQADRNLGKKLDSGFSSLFEAWQLTAIGRDRGLRSQGGSVGVRYDYRVNDHSQLSVSMAPLAVEEFSFINGHSQMTYESKMFYGHQVGAEGTYIFQNGDDAHVRVVYEPQVFIFGDYQLYVEMYYRYTAYQRRSQKRGTHLQEIKMVPKAIYWKGNQDVSFFTMLEFRFRAD